LIPLAAATIILKLFLEFRENMDFRMELNSDVTLIYKRGKDRTL
jgi:hypothetical protein